jgi:hypothetical protein
VVRKAITAYYTAEEQQEIAQAAKRQGISLSGFVAAASSTEVRFHPHGFRPSGAKFISAVGLDFAFRRGPLAGKACG